MPAHDLAPAAAAEAATLSRIVASQLGLPQVYTAAKQSLVRGLLEQQLAKCRKQ